MGMQNSKYLIAGYPFEGNANDIKGVNNGTVSGATFVSGKIGKCASFDGVDDCIKLGTFAGGVTLTTSCWVKLNSAGNFGIITKLPNTSVRGNWSFRTTSGVLELAYISPNDTVNTISTSINLGTNWNYIAFSLDTNVIKIYINATLVKTQNLTLYTNNVDIYAGCQETTAAKRYLNGLIDNVKFHNKVLTQQEIQRDYLNLPIL